MPEIGVDRNGLARDHLILEEKLAKDLRRTNGSRVDGYRDKRHSTGALNATPPDGLRRREDFPP
jgi:hypothetical protein